MITTLTIHRKSGNLEVGVNQGSIRRYNLMSEDFIKLKFSLSENIPLLIGDHVDITKYLHDCDNENFKGEIDPVTGELRDETTKLFVLNRNYYPTFNKETGGWDYDVQIDAYYKQWANRILKFIPDSEDASAEASFSLTDTIENHAGIIIRNLKHAGFSYKGTDITCEIDSEVAAKGIQLVSYQSIDILSAINLIASTYKCEWWMDGGATLWFGFRKEDNKLSLTMNEEIHDASTSDSEGTHATRLYAFGGTTNVPAHYRDKIEFTVTEATSEYVLDKNKPIRPWMFTKMEEADAFTHTFYSQSTDSTDIMRDANFVHKQEISLGTIRLDAQRYEGEVKGVSPDIYIRKLLVFGSSTEKFTINFNYTYKLVSSKETIILGKEKGYNASISSTIYDMMGDMYGVSELDLWYGRIDSSNKLYKSSQNNDAFRMYDPNAAETIMCEATSSYYSGSHFAQFYKPSTDNASWKKLEKGDVLEPLFPRGYYTKAHLYTLLLQGYPDNGPVISHGIQNGASRVSYGNQKRKFRLDDVSKMDVSFSPEFGGEYELKLIVEATSANGLSWQETEKNFNVVFDVSSPTINMTLQPFNAQSASTKVMSNGVTYDAVVNYAHEYAGSDMDMASGTLGSSKIQITGNPLKVGDKFTLPYILRSKVPSHYYDATNKGVQSAVVQRNIMMPEDTPYLQADGVSDDEVVEAIVVYDWIYPKTNMAVQTVTKTPYTYGEGEEAEVVNTYEITLKINNFVWSNMVTNNGDLFAIFQNGEAAGLRFELQEVESKKTATTATFILIPNEDYSVVIPNSATEIKVGDEVILDGINIQYFDENAVAEAENAVKAQAQADLEKMCKEDKVVDITLRSDYAYNQGRLPLGSVIDLHGILSSRVDKDDNLIPYESRIIGFEEKLDIPYDSPKYIVGDSNYYSTIGSIETKLEEVNMGSFALTGAGGKGGNSIPIIRSVDNTYPTDGNVYSAKRVDKQFLNKHEDEQVNGNIQFEKGISVNGGADIDNANINDVNVGNKANIRSLEVVDSSTIGGVQTIKGDQTVQGIQTLHKGFTTHNFNDAGGQIVGAHLTDTGIMTVAGIKAMSLEVFELIYNTIKAQGGKFAFSNSANIEYATFQMKDGSVIPSDAYNYEDWKDEGKDSTWIDGIEYVYLKLKKDDAAKGVPFVNGDIIYGYVNGIGESGQYARYGQCVMHVINPLDDEELEEMVVKAELFPIGDVNTNSGVVVSNIPPADGMAIAQRGNIDPENNPTRLTSFFIDTETANLYMLSNVTSPTLSKANYAVVNGQLPTDLYNEVKKYYDYIKPYDPVVYARYGIFENILQFDHLGNPIQRENNRGEWVEPVFDENGVQVDPYKNMPSYYDTVTYRGSLYKCVESDTIDVPGQGDGWLLLVAKGDADVFMLKANPTSIYVRKDNTASVDYVNVTVGNSTSNGYVVIDTDAKLAEKNMSVYYATDKDTTKKKVSLGAAVKLIITDSGVVITTDAGTPLSTDGDKIYVSPDDDHVIIYLIEDETNIEVDTLFIPVVREGQDGTSIKVTGSYATVADFEAAWKSGDTWIAPENPSDCYVVVSDLYVWVPKDAIWKNVGQFKGDKGADGKDGKDGKAPNENLLNKTSQFDADWTLGTAYIHSATIEDGLDGHKALYISGLSNLKPVAVQNVSLTGGEWYTLSFLAKHNGTTVGEKSRLGKVIGDGIVDTTEDVYVNGISSYAEGMSDVAYTKEWVRYTYTFKTLSTLPDTQTVSLYIKASTQTQMYLCQPKLERGKDATPWCTSESDRRGIAGPAGERGALLSHQGNYDPKVFYTLNRNDDGSIFSIPCVYLPAEKGNGSYLTLKKDMEYSTTIDGVLYPYNPNTLQPIGPDDSEYWTITPYQEQVFTKFLMANYAQFGSEKGAVFFDRFLFSQYGVDRNGRFGHYLDYEDVMWDEDGSLSGEFTPSLAIDMYSGYIKANKLAETFAEYQYDYLPDGSSSSVTLYANEIDFNQTYNIKYNQRYADVCLLTMPLADDINTEPPFMAQADTAIDGLKSIVINRANMNWERSYRATVYEEGLASGFTPFASIVDAAKSSLLLCATPKLFHPYTWYVDGGVIYNDELSSPTGDIASGYFVVDGIVTNFLLIEPGMKAVLRSCRDTSDGKLYWYVENGSDFVSMPYTVYVEMPKVYDSDSSSLINVPTNISKWSNVGYESSGAGAIQRRCFVSKSLYEMYEKLGGSMNIDVVSTGDDVDTVDNWSWEKCITSVSINSKHTDY